MKFYWAFIVWMTLVGVVVAYPEPQYPLNRRDAVELLRRYVEFNHGNQAERLRNKFASKGSIDQYKDNDLFNKWLGMMEAN